MGGGAWTLAIPKGGLRSPVDDWWMALVLAVVGEQFLTTGGGGGGDDASEDRSSLESASAAINGIAMNIRPKINRRARAHT